MSVHLNNVKRKEINFSSFGNGIELRTAGTPSVTIKKIESTKQFAQSTPITALSTSEFKSLDRKFAESGSKTTLNRLVKLKNRSEKKSKHIEQIRQNVARKVQEHKELTQVIRATKKKKVSLHDSVKNINQILKKPGMDIPRSMITRLMFNPNDYVTRYNYPKCLDTFTTTLYKCSPEAYKLIQETFGNVLPSHSKI